MGARYRRARVAVARGTLAFAGLCANGCTGRIWHTFPTTRRGTGAAIAGLSLTERSRRRRCAQAMQRWRAALRGRTRHHGKSTQLAVLDRPRRHVHRHRRAAARTARSPRTSCCPRIPSATRRRRPRHPRAARTAPRTRRFRPARIEAVKMGTTVATNALLERKGERTALVDHPRLRRRAAHRLPEPAEALRAPDRAADAALRARDRGRRAHRRARRASCGRSTSRRRRADAAGGVRRRHPRGRDRADARLPLPAARAGARRRSRARSASRRSRCRTR